MYAVLSSNKTITVVPSGVNKPSWWKGGRVAARVAPLGRRWIAGVTGDGQAVTAKGVRLRQAVNGTTAIRRLVRALGGADKYEYIIVCYKT